VPDPMTASRRWMPSRPCWNITHKTSC